MSIEIHTLKWNVDRSVEDPGTEDATATLGCRVFIDGRELEGVLRARTMHRNDFAVTVITLIAETTIVNHTRESWEAL